MSMRSRKKGIYWAVTRQRIPNQIFMKIDGDDVTKVWNVIGGSVMRVFGGDSAVAWDWFNTPAIALSGDRPVDLVATGNIGPLRDYLTRLEYGVYM